MLLVFRRLLGLVFFHSCLPLDTTGFVWLEDKFPLNCKEVSDPLPVLSSLSEEASHASSRDVCLYLYLSIYMYILSYAVPLRFKIAALCQSLLSHQRQVGLFWKVRGLFVLIFL